MSLRCVHTHTCDDLRDSCQTLAVRHHPRNVEDESSCRDQQSAALVSTRGTSWGTPLCLPSPPHLASPNCIADPPSRHLSPRVVGHATRPPHHTTLSSSPATAASAAAAGGRVECSPRPRGWRRRYGRCNVAAAAGGTRACVAVVVAATTVGAIAARATAAAAAADGVADVADGGALRRYYIPGIRVHDGDRLPTKLAKAARCRIAHAHAEGRRRQRAPTHARRNVWKLPVRSRIGGAPRAMPSCSAAPR